MLFRRSGLLLIFPLRPLCFYLYVLCVKKVLILKIDSINPCYTRTIRIIKKILWV
jgi:hypothetical protein